MISKYPSLVAMLFLILFSNSVFALSDCPVENVYKDKACEGVFVAKSMTDIQIYNQTLGYKNRKIKSLLIDFNLVSASDLSISTSCGIKLSENRSLKVEGRLCLHAENGIWIDSFACRV